MTLLEDPTTTEAPDTGPKQQYTFIESEGAEKMLRHVAIFRPGDYTAIPNLTINGNQSIEFEPGPQLLTESWELLMDGMDDNPYLASLVGFAFIPVFVSLFLCFCYSFCCCPCWCICDRCSKKCCCCHLILNDPVGQNNKFKQWAPFVLLSAALLIVTGACIQGIQNNAEMQLCHYISHHVHHINNTIDMHVVITFSERTIPLDLL